jgi:CxxC motif-containing protein (DUF1111 family)
MNSRKLGIILLSALMLASLGEADPESNSQKKSLAAGKELFTREWLRGDKRSHAGDGLGPLFNGRSCAACHHQGGVGGSGPKQNNVTFVGAFLQLNCGLTGIAGLPVNAVFNPKTPVKQPDRAKLAEIHPALFTEGSFPLHRFSTEKEYREWKVATFLADAPDHSVPERAGEVEVQDLLKLQNLTGQISRTVDAASIALIPSQRNTPALFGVGLIDRIPDRVLEEVAAEQQRIAEKTPLPDIVPSEEEPVALPLAGRVARLKDGRAGRFGWKSQVATLREFTFQACANELGLEVPGFHRSAPPWKKDYKAPGLDLTEEQCDQLFRFVASLLRPVTRPPETPQHAAEIAAGEKLFASAGCVACHRPRLGDVEGIYSDLLLHDMGQSLRDTGSYNTNIEIASTGEVKPLPGNGFGIAPSKRKEKPPSFVAAAREWRTPPLWGLRDSAPYLHDGRADTIADAVKAHDGEGLVAAKAFFELTPRQRQQVELFLQSLAAPTVAMPN